MTSNEYTPEQALDLLLRKLREGDERLLSQVQNALDAGKDVSETEASLDGRKKARVYRKTVPFSHAEAFQIALNALEANFVEQPLFVGSAADNFATAAIGMPVRQQTRFPRNFGDDELIRPEQVGEEKAIEIEMQTETQLSKSSEETVRLKLVPNDQIVEQSAQIALLREMTNFH